MAEFQEVIKQMKRMCAHFSPTCNGCKLCLENGTNEFCGEEPKDIRSDPALVEVAVMTWAAEHPEPVYPSVAKYLERLGIIIRRDGTLEADFFNAHEPMSADVANLLGVDLVEGENEKAD